MSIIAHENSSAPTFSSSDAARAPLTIAAAAPTTGVALTFGFVFTFAVALFFSNGLDELVVGEAVLGVFVPGGPRR